MNKEDIIRMAREHHVNSEYTEFGWQEVSRYEFSLEELIGFAALVAAAEREAIVRIVKDNDDADGMCCTDDVLTAIRAREQA